ncbi:Putative Zn-dependent protease, contains TPR repeats [Roseivivax halotolerans]|uniref:Zn-dependent protease, contains TPR repeats n=2 Tax=Roseivivax halotolerans TaxID=93684 RepID=A0A1I5X5M3_9RHOB|nr:M48 family metalloprotease [Roseivivax halotolerans]SFQ27250.1 Putative Zn-dependent protease, contains TPR repeats [Roseivivax halotolerans]
MRAMRVIILSLCLALVAGTPARALTLLRDADIEYALSELARPIFAAAGLSPTNTKVLLVDDTSLNAFVADNAHILIHSGLLMKLETARSVQAVLAHEAAHIANGHISRRAANMRSARTAAGLGLILSGLAATQSAEAGLGLAVGTQSSVLRNFLAHTRAEEAAADQSAVRYMIRAGIDPMGAVEVMQIFRGQEALTISRQDPYMLTHPLSRDRLRTLEGLANAYGRDIPKDPTAEYWFQRAKGKLTAFERNPGWTLKRAGESATPDIRHMREAVAHHRRADLGRAIQSIDAALAQRPNDPFLLDLKGQILLESRRAPQAIAAYAQAARFAPKSALILGGLGRAQLASGDTGSALATLERAYARDSQDPRLLRDLSVAYAQTGQNGLASAATAERYAIQGRLKDAAIHAERALQLLPRGSPAWRRAEDVAVAARTAARR